MRRSPRRRRCWADTAPAERRAAASGLFTAAAFVGTLPPLVLTALLPRYVDLVSFVMPAAALVVVAFALSIKDRPLDGMPELRSESGRGRAPFSAAFAAVWMQRLAMQSAFSLATTFTLYLIIDRMTGDAVAATPVAMIATLAGGAGIVLGATAMSLPKATDYLRQTH